MAGGGLVIAARTRRTRRGWQRNPLAIRLTETECERLQGYEDSWTAMGNYDGIEKKIPKTQRYKLIGNAVTTDIVALVGKRMKEKLF